MEIDICIYNWFNAHSHIASAMCEAVQKHLNITELMSQRQEESWIRPGGVTYLFSSQHKYHHHQNKYLPDILGFSALQTVSISQTFLSYLSKSTTCPGFFPAKQRMFNLLLFLFKLFLLTSATTTKGRINQFKKHHSPVFR